MAYRHLWIRQAALDADAFSEKQDEVYNDLSRRL